MNSETLEKEKPVIVRLNRKVTKKKAKDNNDKVIFPAQQVVLKDFKEISEHVSNLIQVKSMNLLIAEN
jgi:hypothetical protein